MLSFWDIVLTTKRGIDAVKDIFIFVEDRCELSIDPIQGILGGGCDCKGAASSNHKKLGEILLERGDLDRDAIENAARRQKPIGQLLVEAGAVDPGLVESAIAEQQHIRKISEERAAKEQSSTIRVPADKLDMLVNLVGELVTIQARLARPQPCETTQSFSSCRGGRTPDGRMRDNAMNIRMLPIGTTFSKFKRLVHDLSAELGKKIVLETERAETELDKTVIERLNDPLVHLIRNSIDHGIELPEARKAAGKPEQGVVRLSAVRSGANVLIRITDDGAGLDRDAIRSRGVEKGLIAAGAELSDKEYFLFHFGSGIFNGRRRYQHIRPRCGNGCGEAQYRGASRVRGDRQPKGIGCDDHAQAPADAGNYRRIAGRGWTRSLRAAAFNRGRMCRVDA